MSTKLEDIRAVVDKLHAATRPPFVTDELAGRCVLLAKPLAVAVKAGSPVHVEGQYVGVVVADAAAGDPVKVLLLKDSSRSIGTDL